jgi:hypothetical protein
MMYLISRFIAFGIIVSIFAGLSGEIAAATPVGQVTRISGACTAETDGRKRTLEVSSTIELLDIVTTGSGARLVLEMDDGTVLTLGENAKLEIDEFVFNQPGGAARLRLHLAGAFRFISGGIGKSKDSVTVINTRIPVLGVRGTDFWAGPLDGKYGVLLFNGVVDVMNSGVSAHLHAPGEGTNVVEGEPPGAVTLWPQDKVRRALRAVAF